MQKRTDTEIYNTDHAAPSAVLKLLLLRLELLKPGRSDLDVGTVTADALLDTQESD